MSPPDRGTQGDSQIELRGLTLSYYHVANTRHGYSHFSSKIKPKSEVYHFYPFATDPKDKISELQAITFDDEYANDAQTGAALPKPEICKNRFFG